MRVDHFATRITAIILFLFNLTLGAFATWLALVATVIGASLAGFYAVRTEQSVDRATALHTGRLAGALSGVAAAFGLIGGTVTFLLTAWLFDWDIRFSGEFFSRFPAWLVVAGGNVILAFGLQLVATICGPLGARRGLSSLEKRQVQQRLASQPRPDHADWEKKPMVLRPEQFSSGSTRPWEWYFSGDSKVAVRTVDDIVRWLQQCKYVYDRDLFMESDFWQHPLTFEQLKLGDCEDHALWAWRKMIELDIDAEFVVGTFLESGGGHAWIMYVENGVAYAFEATRKRTSPIMSLEEAARQFRPRYSVDRQFRTYRYVGATPQATPQPIDE